ncbi:tripartite tricarboxylate transporter TctB family protein [Halobellus sp. Atlit-38R]|uniref:tripartite tricarboxylate transporter TctB family protein n=1 Tax=Halobellus sp. Atlit-38R TaxID=2282131 RepID=UPI0013141603|nr:tripartite tricarboxylate transporter TctB family protein [Halobellus sp. Atlit-38R]
MENTRQNGSSATGVKSLVLRQARRLDSNHFEALFIGLLFTYTLLLIYTALGYGSQPRLFPLLVGGPLLGLIILRLDLLLTNHIQLGSSGVFQDMTDGLMDDEPNPIDPMTKYRREAEIILWLVTALVLVWAIGFQIALVVFVFLFVYSHERDLIRALGSTLIAYGIVYLLFVQLLSVNLYEPALLPESIMNTLP